MKQPRQRVSRKVSEREDLQEKILETTRKREPETVNELIEFLEEDVDLSRDVLMEEVIELENQGRLRLTHKPGEIPNSLNDYLFSRHAIWFWVILALSASTTATVFTITSDSSPLIYVRYVLGSIFVLLLPGFSLIKTLFPTKEIDDIERTALSIGMSLALVPLVGLLLNYTPWGIRLTPITLSLLALTTFLTITGLIREHSQKLEENAELNGD